MEHVIYGKYYGVPFTARTADINGFLRLNDDESVAIGVANERTGEEDQTLAERGELEVIAIVAQGRNGALNFDEAMEAIK